MANKSKIFTYGANIAGKALANSVIKPLGRKISQLTETAIPSELQGLDLGNFWNVGGASYFAALDLLGACSDRIKNSKFTRLSKFAGTGVYGLPLLGGLVQLASGDFSAAPETFLDGLMTYQLGKDTLNAYSAAGKDLLDDLTVW